MRVVGPLLFQATFNCAPYPPVLSCHSGCLGLLRWGVAVSPGPRGTSSPSDSYYPGAVPFLCPCLGSRQTAFRGPPFSWRRDLPQLGPEALPSVALPLPTILPMKNPYLNKLKRPYSAVQRPVGTPIRSSDMQRLITASYIPKKARGGSQAWPTALDCGSSP